MLFRVRSVYAYAAMIRIIMHIRRIQKGTRMRFFHIIGCGAAMMCGYNGDASVKVLGAMQSLRNNEQGE